MLIYLISLPVWNFVLPTYAYWKFDDFSWGDTRKTAGEKTKKAGIEYEGEFDSSKITMKRWGDFEGERRARNGGAGYSQPGAGSHWGNGGKVGGESPTLTFGSPAMSAGTFGERGLIGGDRKQSQLGFESSYDY